MKKTSLHIINRGPVTIIKKKLTAGEVALGVLGVIVSLGLPGLIDQKFIWFSLCVSLSLIWLIVHNMIKHIKINHLTQELFIYGLVNKKRYFVDDLDYIACHKLLGGFVGETSYMALLVFKNGRRRRLWVTDRNRAQELADYFSGYLSREVELI